MTIWPIDVGIGNKVGRPENARTFVNRAAHTGSGLRRSPSRGREQRPRGSPSVRARSWNDELHRFKQRVAGRRIWPQGIQEPALRHGAGNSLSAARQGTSREAGKSARLNCEVTPSPPIDRDSLTASSPKHVENSKSTLSTGGRPASTPRLGCSYVPRRDLARRLRAMPTNSSR